MAPAILAMETKVALVTTDVLLVMEHARILVILHAVVHRHRQDAPTAQTVALVVADQVALVVAREVVQAVVGLVAPVVARVRAETIVLVHA